MRPTRHKLIAIVALSLALAACGGASAMTLGHVVIGRSKDLLDFTRLTCDLIGAMRAGVRYARHSPILRSILVRSCLFVFFASALWALLPIVARDRLGRGY